TQHAAFVVYVLHVERARIVAMSETGVNIHRVVRRQLESRNSGAAHKVGNALTNVRVAQAEVSRPVRGQRNRVVRTQLRGETGRVRQTTSGRSVQKVRGCIGREMRVGECQVFRKGEPPHRRQCAGKLEPTTDRAATIDDILVVQRVPGGELNLLARDVERAHIEVERPVEQRGLQAYLVVHGPVRTELGWVARSDTHVGATDAIAAGDSCVDHGIRIQLVAPGDQEGRRMVVGALYQVVAAVGQAGAGDLHILTVGAVANPGLHIEGRGEVISQIAEGGIFLVKRLRRRGDVEGRHIQWNTGHRVRCTVLLE